MNIALIGNPNAGKSSVFNQLTGLRQKTGNFPGVTVDKKTGTATLPSGERATIIDLPGAYSLYPNSIDEGIVAEILCDRSHPLFPDKIIYVADANNLERHLLLCSQLIDMQLPMVIALTMTDIAEKDDMQLNIAALEVELKIEIIPVNGRTGKGIFPLLEKIEKAEKPENKFSESHPLSPDVIDSLKKQSGISNDYVALLLAHHFQRTGHTSDLKKEIIEEILKKNSFDSLRLQVDETMLRFDKITALLSKVIVKNRKNDSITFTEKLDNYLTHPVFGSLIFLGMLFLIFQAIFEWAVLPMELIDAGFSQLSIKLSEILPEHPLSDLLTNGVIPGIAGICIFIPQITILFALVVFLEDVGYMSRAIFLSDNLMRKYGLNGRSVVSLFSGLACAVPAIMATRTITNWKERLITLMVTPLVSCSARIPVFTILIALVISEESRFIIFNTQGIVMFGLYLLGVSSALGAAYVMKLIIKTTERSYLVMELPSYKTPHWKNIVLSVIEKVKIFITQAGKVILVISMLLWVLASYGPGKKMEQAATETLNTISEDDFTEEELETLIATRQMEASYAGIMGKWIEPVIRPLGFDWKIGIALITSFAAREVFVGTMATLYSVGGENDEQTVLEKLRTEKNPVTGLKVFTPAVALSLLMFYVFAMQCMSTVAVVRSETKSWKWPLIQFFYMTALAYLASLTTFQLMS